MDPLDTVFDFQNCRAIVVDGHEDAVMTWTTAADLASAVARVVNYDGEWPEVGGIRGNRVTSSQVIKIGEKIRGTRRFYTPLGEDLRKLRETQAAPLLSTK